MCAFLPGWSEWEGGGEKRVAAGAAPWGWDRSTLGRISIRRVDRPWTWLLCWVGGIERDARVPKRHHRVRWLAPGPAGGRSWRSGKTLWRGFVCQQPLGVWCSVCLGVGGAGPSRVGGRVLSRGWLGLVRVRLTPVRTPTLEAGTRAGALRWTRSRPGWVEGGGRWRARRGGSW